MCKHEEISRITCLIQTSHLTAYGVKGLFCNSYFLHTTQGVEPACTFLRKVNIGITATHYFPSFEVSSYQNSGQRKQILRHPGTWVTKTNPLKSRLKESFSIVLLVIIVVLHIASPRQWNENQKKLKALLVLPMFQAHSLLAYIRYKTIQKNTKHIHLQIHIQIHIQIQIHTHTLHTYTMHNVT